MFTHTVSTSKSLLLQSSDSREKRQAMKEISEYVVRQMVLPALETRRSRRAAREGVWEQGRCFLTRAQRRPLVK